MKNMFQALAVLLTLFSLTGCGLKGPLYFPPADKNAPPPVKPVDPQTQSTTPVKNDRATEGGPSQVNY
ncbi:TPA: lipoprotein [Citrobacter freundii]